MCLPGVEGRFPVSSRGSSSSPSPHVSQSCEQQGPQKESRSKAPQEPRMLVFNISVSPQHSIKYRRRFLFPSLVRPLLPDPTTLQGSFGPFCTEPLLGCEE